MRYINSISMVAGLLLVTAATAMDSEGKKPWWPCCTVWSSFQDRCIEGSKNFKQVGCAPPRGDGVLGTAMNSPPEGEYAIPADCAVWRIQSKTCLVPKEGYPGDYIDDDGNLVHGGQMP